MKFLIKYIKMNFLNLPNEIQLEIMEKLKRKDLNSLIKSNKYSRKLFKKHINLFKKLFPVIIYPEYRQYSYDYNETGRETEIGYEEIMSKYDFSIKGDSIIVMYTSGNYKLTFKGWIILDEQKTIMINESFDLFNELPPSFINKFQGVKVYFKIPEKVSSKFEDITIEKMDNFYGYLVTFYYKNTPFILILSENKYFITTNGYSGPSLNPEKTLLSKYTIFCNIEEETINDFIVIYKDSFKNIIKDIPKCNIFTIRN